LKQPGFGERGIIRVLPEEPQTAAGGERCDPPVPARLPRQGGRQGGAEDFVGQPEPEEEQAPAAQDPGLPCERLPVQGGVRSYQLGNVTNSH
jgi:hypothetical protein